MSNGNDYETKAREFLRLQGYRIIQNNFHSRFGEIDIIAIDKRVISFIEVKGRSADCLYAGAEAVTPGKREKIKKTALAYVSRVKNSGQAFRFDVLEIVQGRSWRQFNLIKNAFSMND